jgi:hypothetical protein
MKKMLLISHKIDNALKSGRKVNIAYVYRDPVKAFEEGVIPRMKGVEGRPVNLDYHLRTHERALSTIEKLEQHYKDNPGVNIYTIDNSGKIGDQKLSSIEEVKKNNYLSNDAKQQLRNISEQQFRSGAISAEQYRALAGKEVHERGMEEHDGEGISGYNGTRHGAGTPQSGEPSKPGENAASKEQIAPGNAGESSEEISNSDAETEGQNNSGEKIKVLKKRARPTIKSPLYKKALETDAEDPHSQVLKYFIAGGRIHTDALKELFGDVKELS